jgi:hypothetical protein
MKLPFVFTVAGMCSTGKFRERAKIEYEKTGQEKERALLNLEYDTEELKRTAEYKIKKLSIDRKYGCIDDFQYEIEMNKINTANLNENDLKIKELDIYLKYKKISSVEYCKQKNDILGKPWVAIRTNYDENIDPDNMEVEVVYNNTFIKNMKAKGLPGITDEEIAEQWLKLFFIANLEEDDLKMISDEYSYETSDDNKKYVKKKKLSDSSTYIG